MAVLNERVITVLYGGPAVTEKEIASRQKKKTNHGKRENLTAKRKRLTPKEKPHGKRKNLAAKRKRLTAKERASLLP